MTHQHEWYQPEPTITKPSDYRTWFCVKCDACKIEQKVWASTWSSLCTCEYGSYCIGVAPLWSVWQNFNQHTDFDRGT